MAIYITRIRFTYLIASQDIVQQCDGWMSGRGGRWCLWIFGATDSPQIARVCWRQVSLQLPPRILNILCVRTGVMVYKVVQVIDCEMLPVILIQLLVCSPTVCYHCRSVVDVFFNNTQQCLTVSFVLRAQCNRYLVRLATDPTHDPLFLNCPSPIVFSFPEFHFVDFHCQIFTADFARWMTNQCFQLNFPKVC